MRNKIRFSALLMSIFFAFTFTVQAHVEADPESTTPQPFSFYCAPYTDPFVEGGEYTPTHNGICHYTLPQTNPHIIVAVYKGHVGSNSTLIQEDLPSSIWSLSTSPNSFGTNNPGDDFFAVSYSIFGSADAALYRTYFETGAGDPPSDLAYLAWKWGPDALPPPDSVAPTIVITNPENGSSHLQNEITFVNAAFTDESEIATTTYTLNGHLFDGSFAIPLTSVPLGSTVLVISATDVFGNIGYATSTFTIIADTTAPLVVINSPVEGEIYANNQTNVFAEANITDEQSPIASATYYFDSTLIDPVYALPLVGASIGTHTVTVRATDTAGNTGSATKHFTVRPWDNGAPIITITNPVQGQTYLKTATVLINASITDPEGSTITSKTYRFNGNPINPAVALPFSTAPVGTSILEITAVDQYGNVGQATTTFAIQTPSQATTTLLTTADTYVRGGAKNTNEGISPILRIQGAGDNRVLVRFNQSSIANLVAGGTLISARLEFDIEDQKNNWGPAGREVAIHRLLANWAEGNGKNAELPGPQSTRGTGSGATWDCAIDTNITNQQPDCTEENDWNMRLKKQGPFLAPWVEDQTDGVVIQRGAQGSISYDVTADVNSFLNGTPNYGWIVLKSLSFKPGYISFHSKDAGATHAPRLILNYIPGH